MLNLLKCICTVVTLHHRIKTNIAPASGWYAVYQQDDGLQYYPLVGWEITYLDESPIEATGLVFENNKPSSIAYADELPQFIGYQLQQQQQSDVRAGAK